jgi:hypothetical protein
MGSRQRIEAFLKAVRRRLHLRRGWLVGAWTLLGVAAAMLVVALVYVVQGYAVPRLWYAASAGLGVLAATMAWLVLREDADRAARFADRFFGLHDTLVSWLHFHRKQRTDGFYALQAEATVRDLESLDARTVDWRPPRRLAALSIAAAILAVALGFKGPTESVLQQLALEEATLAQTEVINRDLEELVRDLDAQTIDEEERKLLNPDGLQELTKSLRETKDQKEALRQYARLEAQLQQFRTKLEQRRDQQLLAEAAKELEHDRATKPLASQFAQQQYKEAAQQLASWKPQSARSLTEQQKQLARLKAASQRMAAAVQNQRGRSGAQTASRAQTGQSSSAQSGGQGGAGGAAAGAQGESGGELGEAIENVADSVRELDDALQHAARQQRESGKCDADSLAQCQACQQNAERDLERLAQYLTRMGIKCDASKKLAALCKACSQCQGGLCQSQCASPNAGGKKAGWGSNIARRDVVEELLDNGQTTLLQGIKGEGPSQTTVETAEDGTGTSGRIAAGKKRSFQRQFEAFVSREDVPEQVRSGVKNYFQSINNIDEARTTNDE